ncbi:MAG: histidine phosphatase family protein [Bacteroidales bacterium]|jgi:phosphohistidine phosphatase
MKKIIFVRHGRAEEQSAELTDFERSLTLKGKVISRQMAKRMKEKEKNPGLIITSPAFRAMETAFIFAEEFGISHEIILINSGLYFRTGIKTLIGIIGSLDNEINTITLFGHNPSFTEIADRLCSGGCEFLTKTSVVCISFQTTDWSGIKLDSGKLEYFLKPEKLS